MHFFLFVGVCFKLRVNTLVKWGSVSLARLVRGLFNIILLFPHLFFKYPVLFSWFLIYFIGVCRINGEHKLLQWYSCLIDHLHLVLHKTWLGSVPVSWWGQPFNLSKYELPCILTLSLVFSLFSDPVWIPVKSDYGFHAVLPLS